MKTIGLLGGMSWESSIEYYRIINESVKRRLGGLHSAQCLMYSVDFAEIESLQHAEEWDKLTDTMIAAVRRLQQGGADFLVICTNTMHRMAKEIEAAVQLPLLHIADATAEAIKAQRIKTIGLLGTRFTMEGDFYRGKLEKDHNLQILIPDNAGREIVHRIIYDELVQGQIRAESRTAYLDVIANLQSAGAQGIILGCTEIPLLVKKEDVNLPVFDTTTIQRQCEKDFVNAFLNIPPDADAILSLACGAGVQTVAEAMETLPVIPALNTSFLGSLDAPGIWREKCQGCGNCLLAFTGGICPVSRCAKHLLNGPCGGSKNGKCEIGEDIDCAWQLIIDRLKVLGRLDEYEKLFPLKDWSTDRGKGPRVQGVDRTKT